MIIIFSDIELLKKDKKQNKILEKHHNESIESIVINKTPNGIVVLDITGKIIFVNKAIGTILGSVETIGLNILTFPTVQNSNLYGAIKKALIGQHSEIRKELYTSYTSKEQKYLNMYVYPDFNEKSEEVDKVIIIIEDITLEAKLQEKNEKTFLSTIETLAQLVDARDAYTGEHSKNVSNYVTKMCDKLNLNDKEKREIEIAASFHDIGKIGIKDNILNKEGKLTDDEYNTMKLHPTIGWRIIRKIEDFDNISEIIKHHHERWDGKGYPDGISGNDIPLGSQIIAIADTYDAVTSNRIYRKQLSKETGLKILNEEKQKQFNPRLVDVFIKIIDV
jgi:putative nucleotidyltransferase with HDIG domain/PAS domain S-box-containing protein